MRQKGPAGKRGPPLPKSPRGALYGLVPMHDAGTASTPRAGAGSAACFMPTVGRDREDWRAGQSKGQSEGRPEVARCCLGEETLAEIGKSHNVSGWTIARLMPSLRWAD